MAITKGTPTVTSGSLTTGFTLVINAGVQANDILVVGITNRDATANPTCVDNEGAGSWTRLTTVNAATNGSISIWWKRASASTAGKTITVGGCTGSASGVVMPYRGCSTGSSPFGTPVGEANISGNETQAGITTTRAGSLVILLVGCTSNDTLNPTTYTATDPTSLTEDGEGVSIGGSDCSLSIASAVKATAGATGSISWAQTDGTGASLAVELLPAIETLTAASGLYTITGTAAVPAYNRKIVADSASFAMTGTSAALARGFALAAASGAFAVAGTDATPKYSRLVAAAPGSFATTGTAATPRYGRLVAAASGSYAVTGTAATLTYAQDSNRRLVADSASFVVTGTAATLEYGRAVVAASGSYALTGASATLKYNRMLTAATGSFEETGTAAALKYGRLVTAGAGAVTVSGTSAASLYNRLIAAGSGAFALTGTGVAFGYDVAQNYTLTCASGAFVLTGSEAELTIATAPQPKRRSHATGFSRFTRVARGKQTWARRRVR